MDDAKKDVLERINNILGVKISENDLTLFEKQALTSIAQTLRQLIIIKQMLMIEQTKDSKLVYRIIKNLKKDNESKEISTYLKEIAELQNLLNNKISDFANNLIEAKSKINFINEKPSINKSTEISFIQPLRCTNCGGKLKLLSSTLAICEYCQMNYTLMTYLNMLRQTIEKPFDNTRLM